MHRVKSCIVRVGAPWIAILSCLAMLAAFALPAHAALTAVLQCTIVDVGRGEAIPARCRIIDRFGGNRYPPLAMSLYHSAGGGYFYTGGAFSVTVPTGSVVVHAGRGFEYGEIIDTVNVQADTSIVVSLSRFIAMDGLGWYAGDNHVHINHAGGYYILDPEDAHRVGRAEGVNVVHCLDNEYYFLGAPDPCSTPDCIVFMTEEMRSASFGHVDLLGMSSLISPYSSTWWPMLADVADSAHARSGALIVSAHPISSYEFDQVETWPGSGIARELPVDCIAGGIDAMDVMSYSNCAIGGIELDMWYRLLNCGFRMPASAGTDAVVNRVDSAPLGGFRVYVRIPGGALSYGAWLESLAAGRTFVTNGPLITRFEIDGHSPGETIEYANPGPVVSGVVSVRSAYPVDLVEIVRNGLPALTYSLQPPRSSFDTSFVLSLSGSSWIASRVYGVKQGWIPTASSLFAHTSPVYCTVEGERIRDRGDAEFFVHWIEDLESLAHSKGQWYDPIQASIVFDELAAAREYYEALAFGTVTSVDGSDESGAETPLALACGNAPNPFGRTTVIDFEVLGPSGGQAGGSMQRRDVHVSVAVYDVSGRLVKRLVDGAHAAGRHRIEWDGRDERGGNAASGIYFARLSAAGRTLSRKMLLVR